MASYFRPPACVYAVASPAAALFCSLTLFSTDRGDGPFFSATTFHNQSNSLWPRQTGRDLRRGNRDAPLRNVFVKKKSWKPRREQPACERKSERKSLIVSSFVLPVCVLAWVLPVLLSECFSLQMSGLLSTYEVQSFKCGHRSFTLFH